MQHIINSTFLLYVNVHPLVQLCYILQTRQNLFFVIISMRCWGVFLDSFVEHQATM
jgi:hypothetical protein